MVTTRTMKVSTIMDESASEKYARTLSNLSYDEIIMAAFVLGRYEESDKTATSKLNDLIMRQGEMIDNDVHYQSTSSATRLGTWLDYLNTQMDKVYENGYTDGHDDGYIDATQDAMADMERNHRDGYMKGHWDGIHMASRLNRESREHNHQDAYNLGYNEGHDDGYIDATQDAMDDIERSRLDGYVKGHVDGLHMASCLNRWLLHG